MLIAAVLTAYVVTLAPIRYSGPAPETAERRKERLAMVAEVVSEVASEGTTQWRPDDVAALVLATWVDESALEYWVHAGGVSPLGNQDGGRARCLGQIQTWPGNTLLSPDEHRALVGVDRAATKRCAQATVEYYWAHRRCLRSRQPAATRWKSALKPGELALLAAAYGKGWCAPVGRSASTLALRATRIRERIWHAQSQ